MAGHPISDPLREDPPAFVAQRVAPVQPDVLNTIRLLHDPKDTGSARWYETTKDPARTSQPVPIVRPGNEVMYLVDGADTYKEMVAVIKSASSADHFIYLLGWIMFEKLEMIPGDPTSTM